MPVRNVAPAIVSSTPRIVAPVVPRPSRDHALEAVADRAAVRVTEREQQAGDRDAETEPERPHVDELAARHDQPAERDEDERSQVRGGADGCLARHARPARR